jgi:hypothetical protein
VMRNVIDDAEGLSHSSCSAATGDRAQSKPSQPPHRPAAEHTVYAAAGRAQRFRPSAVEPP